MGIHIRVDNTRFHMTVLRKLFPAVAAKVQREMGNKLPNDGWVKMNVYVLPQIVKDELIAALVECGKQDFDQLAKLAPPAPPDDSMEKHQEYTKKVEADIAAQGKVIAEKNAAIARLDEYSRVRGLLPSDNNIKRITEFIDNSPKLPENFRGRWTVQIIDLAVKFLTHEGVLEFGKKEVAPVATPAPAETLGTLPDGSRQLPLALPCPTSATLAQAKDYLARVRGQQQPGVIHVEGFKAALR
jgi:hypothetical protein